MGFLGPLGIKEGGGNSKCSSGLISSVPVRASQDRVTASVLTTVAGPGARWPLSAVPSRGDGHVQAGSSLRSPQPHFQRRAVVGHRNAVVPPDPRGGAASLCPGRALAESSAVSPAFLDSIFWRRGGSGVSELSATTAWPEGEQAREAWSQSGLTPRCACTVPT